MSPLTYLFWPNPGNAHYSDPKVQLALIACGLLIAASVALRYWRKSLTNPATRTLSATWPSVTFWFGATGLVLVVSRVESIQFLAMRALWLLWGVVIVLYVLFQMFQFRRRHYVIVRQEKVVDARDRYLPRKKK